MTDQLPEQADNVVQFPSAAPKKANEAAARKWGKEVIKIGYSIVPSLLLRAQQRLGINPTQLAILLQISDFWWDEGRKPYPSKETLSQRLGLKERHIQRHIAELEKAGLVKRTARYDPATGARTSNAYDLSGLVARLKQLEPEFSQVEQENRRRRRAVQTPGGLAGRAPKPPTAATIPQQGSSR